MTRETQRKK